MIYYFVIEENVSKIPAAYGTKYICKGGHRYKYGEYIPEHGYDNQHKAELEQNAAIRFHKTSLHKTNADVWKHYIETIDINEKEQI